MSAENIVRSTEERMKASLQHTERTLQRIRAGRAHPDMLSHIQVEYHSTQMPITQVASIVSTDARTLHIKPWEKALIAEIEKSIQQSDLDLTPQNNGESVIITLPPLSEERRIRVVKQVKEEIEQGRVRMRNLRKEANEQTKKLDLSQDEQKSSTVRIQGLTDKYITLLDALLKHKEQEIMQV